MTITPLNKDSILHAIEAFSTEMPINLHVLTEIDSTNQFLKQRPPSALIEVCCAETQTLGRGRRGNTWHSPYGENIYLSIRWKIPVATLLLSAMGLVVSLAILDAIHLIAPDVYIKWPNDLIWNMKKLSGILVEMITTVSGCQEVIIGVGLNVSTSASCEAWCSLYDITGKHYDRNKLIAHILISLNSHLNQFFQQGFGVFQARWQAADYLYQRAISLTQAHQTFNGIAQGVTTQGLLRLVDNAGIHHMFSSGDIHITAIDGQPRP